MVTFKGIVSVISNDPPCKDDDARFTIEPLKSYLINNVKDIVVFLGMEGFISDNFCIFYYSKKCASHFGIETTIECNQFLKLLTLI